MTFVTATARSRQTWGWEVSKELFGRPEFSFQSLQIVNDHAASIDPYQAFGLEAGKIPGNQLADRSCKLLGRLKRQNRGRFSKPPLSASRPPLRRATNSLPCALVSCLSHVSLLPLLGPHNIRNRLNGDNALRDRLVQRASY